MFIMMMVIVWLSLWGKTLCRLEGGNGWSLEIYDQNNLLVFSTHKGLAKRSKILDTEVLKFVWMQGEGPAAIGSLRDGVKPEGGDNAVDRFRLVWAQWPGIR